MTKKEYRALFYSVIDQMWAMHVIVRNLNNEGYYESWIVYVPDGLDDYEQFTDAYAWLRLSELLDDYANVERLFRNIMRRALKDDAWCSIPTLEEVRRK